MAGGPPSTLQLPPLSSLHPAPSTLQPPPYTLHLAPYTHYPPSPCTLHPLPYLEVNPSPQAPNLKSQPPNPNPTPNPTTSKPQAPDFQTAVWRYAREHETQTTVCEQWFSSHTHQSLQTQSQPPTPNSNTPYHKQTKINARTPSPKTDGRWGQRGGGGGRGGPRGRAVFGCPAAVASPRYHPRLEKGVL